MQAFLPMFPLELVVFPGEELKLHIFEPRYRQLIAECRDEGVSFGIPAYINRGVAEYGTEMRLVEIFQTYDSGEMDVLTQGERAFRLESFVKVAPGKLYAGGEVTRIENDPDCDSESENTMWALFERLHEILGTGHTRDRVTRANPSFLLAQESGLSLPQRVQLLAIASERDRQTYLIEHYQRVIPVLEAAEDTKDRVKANGRFIRQRKLDL